MAKEKCLMIVLALALMPVGCTEECGEQSDGLTLNAVKIIGNSLALFEPGVGTRESTVSSLEEGSLMELYCKGGVESNGTLLTLGADGVWTSDDALKWTSDDDAQIVAYSPPLSSVYQDGALVDLVRCDTSASYLDDVSLSFSHAFARIVFNVADELNSSLETAEFTTSVTATGIDAWSGEIECVEEQSLCTMDNDAEGEYVIFVPPLTALYVGITITLTDGTVLTSQTDSMELEAGISYSCDVDRDSLRGIYTADDLVAFSNLINGNDYEDRSLDEFGVEIDGVMTYRLMNDIIMTSELCELFSTIGPEYNDPFSECFDGQGYSIYGLQGELPSLFTYIGSEGVVRNLTLDGADVVGTASALLCAVNYGIMDRCRIEGSAINLSQSAFVGPLTARNYGTMVNCSVVGSYLTNTYSGSDDPEAAAIVGANYGTMINCYAATDTLSATYTSGVSCQTVSASVLTNIYAYKITLYGVTSHAGIVNYDNSATYTWCFSGSSTPIGNKSGFPEGTYRHTQASGELPVYDGVELFVYFNNWVDENAQSYSDFDILRWTEGDLTEPFVFDDSLE